MKTLKEQIAELRAVGYKALPAQAKVAHDAVLLAMHRSGFKLKSAIKGGVVMSSITGDIRRATMDMDIDFVHHTHDEMTQVEYGFDVVTLSITRLASGQLSALCVD